MPRAALPPLHVVTDDAVVGGADFLARASAVLEAGGAELVLHLRAPGADGRFLYERAAALVPRARAAGARLLVNDRVDVALACGADGAHVGARGLPVHDARRLLGPARWLGASVHDEAEARAAAAGGADFLLVGTIYATASHPGRAGAGPDLLRRLAPLARPMVAIGGIDPARVAEVRAAGAAAVAVLRGVWAADDVAAAVERYRNAWKGVAR